MCLTTTIPQMAEITGLSRSAVASRIKTIYKKLLKEANGEPLNERYTVYIIPVIKPGVKCPPVKTHFYSMHILKLLVEQIDHPHKEEMLIDTDKLVAEDEEQRNAVLAPRWMRRRARKKLGNEYMKLHITDLYTRKAA